MRMPRCVLAALALSVVSPLAQAQAYPNTENFGVDFDHDAPWYQACLRVRHAVPAAQAATAAPACDARAAYYTKLDQAVTSAAEWAAVRACAAASNDSAVLSMLYANGLGVARNTDVATFYACSTGAAHAEMAARVAHLATLAPAARFDLCDDITSGRMGGECAAIAASRAERIETAYFARLRATLSGPQARAFDRLVKANARFAQAHGSGETARGGSGYVGFMIGAQARESEWLREHLLAFEKGKFQLPPPSQFASDDAELNRRYRARIAPGAAPDEYAIAPAALRAAQRAWLAYRDAWVDFAALRYPQVPAAALQALLTQWRIAQL
ncbi:lysozyme inhibitor LprI family protein [Massilia sp. DWR3-1-1]|uniref:lysozyme inhibitor LprI family protein n=1 Tax=Massilia sp. DWR3-1-1 TaxID=2804559 RepID=UPI003CEFAD02